MLNCADEALEIAESSIVNMEEALKLAKEEAHVDSWESEYEIDPFTVPISEKLELLNKIDKELKKDKKIINSISSMQFEKKHTWFYSTEGSNIEQKRIISGGGFSATALEGSFVQTRSYPASFGGQYKQMGYEFIKSLNLLDHVEKTRNEAIALLNAPECPSGVMDIILHPNQMMLQIHESVGHASELDRVLGQEANFAGTSFLTTDKYKNFKYGSKIVNLVADTTLKNGIATMAYDDDGVKAKRWHIVKDGILNGYMTNRETAKRINEKESKGANRASSWFHLPITRITNLSLMPGDSSFEEMVKSIDYGIYMETNKSWSIDQRRLNFQFACEIGYEIKDGKFTGKIFKDPIYQGVTPEFWSNCDMISSKEDWDIWGVMNCGKGQPMQVIEMSHGSSFVKFKNIKVGVTK